MSNVPKIESFVLDGAGAIGGVISLKQIQLYPTPETSRRARFV